MEGLRRSGLTHSETVGRGGTGGGGDGGSAEALIRFLSDSIGPALSHSAKEAHLLREDNRKLREMLADAIPDLGATPDAAASKEEMSGGRGGGRGGQQQKDLEERLKHELQTKVSLVQDILLLQGQVEELQQQVELRELALRKAFEQAKGLEDENAALRAERSTFLEAHSSMFEEEVKKAVHGGDEARAQLLKVQLEAHELRYAVETAKNSEQAAQVRLVEATDLQREMEQEFVTYKHMTHQAKELADATVHQLQSEVQALQKACEELETVRTAMSVDLGKVCSELQALRVAHQEVTLQLQAEKQSAIGRFKLWEQELEDRAAEVQELTAQLQHKESDNRDIPPPKRVEVCLVQVTTTLTCV